jgi:hypothetical protein
LNKSDPKALIELRVLIDAFKDEPAVIILSGPYSETANRLSVWEEGCCRDKIWSIGYSLTITLQGAVE